MGANLCTIADVEALLQHSITEDARTTALLEMATAELEATAGREFLPGAQTGVAVPSYPRNGLYLPHWPLASVEAVTEDGTALVAGTDYATPTAEDLSLGRLRRRDENGAAWLWPDSRTVDHLVVVDYTPAVPANLRTHCARLVAQAIQAGAAAANVSEAGALGFKQLTVGRWSATQGGAGSVAVGIMLDEAAASAAEAWRDRIAL